MLQQQLQFQQQQAQQQLAGQNNATNVAQLMNDLTIKEKIHALIEKTKQEDEKRRKQEEEYSLQVRNFFQKAETKFIMVF
jgi:hypothetical protein